MEKTKIADLFASVQGEGLYVGQKQVFVRFSGCNLDCGYCDEPASRRPENAKDMTADQLREAIKKLARESGADALSLTGGEPLLHAQFITHLLPGLRRLETHLETNATLWQEYKEVDSLIDVVSADIKLPQEDKLWDAHRQFLLLCRDKAFVKIVLTGAATRGDCERAVEVIKSVSRNIPLVWQPSTKNEREHSSPPEDGFLSGILDYSRQKLSNVRSLPQQHPLWNVK